MGLLPDVAADFQVSEATAGWLTSGYALAVVVGALVLTAAVTRFERKPALAVLLLLFIAGNLISAAAPGYGMMMAGRIVAALAHGAFFGIGAAVAADMVAPAKKAAAIAIMFTGLIAANVPGVPFGTTTEGRHRHHDRDPPSSYPGGLPLALPRRRWRRHCLVPLFFVSMSGQSKGDGNAISAD